MLPCDGAAASSAWTSTAYRKRQSHGGVDPISRLLVRGDGIEQIDQNVRVHEPRQNRSCSSGPLSTRRRTVWICRIAITSALAHILRPGAGRLRHRLSSTPVPPHSPTRSPESPGCGRVSNCRHRQRSSDSCQHLLSPLIQRNTESVFRPNAACGACRRQSTSRAVIGHSASKNEPVFPTSEGGSDERRCTAQPQGVFLTFSWRRFNSTFIHVLMLRAWNEAFRRSIESRRLIRSICRMPCVSWTMRRRHVHLPTLASDHRTLADIVHQSRRKSDIGPCCCNADALAALGDVLTSVERELAPYAGSVPIELVSDSLGKQDFVSGLVTAAARTPLRWGETGRTGRPGEARSRFALRKPHGHDQSDTRARLRPLAPRRIRSGRLRMGDERCFNDACCRYRQGAFVPKCRARSDSCSDAAPMPALPGRVCGTAGCTDKCPSACRTVIAPRHIRPPWPRRYRIWRPRMLRALQDLRRRARLLATATETSPSGRGPLRDDFERVLREYVWSGCTGSASSG